MPEKFRLTSSPLLDAPWMVKSYRYAISVGDDDFTNIFKRLYPELPDEALDELARGNYVLSLDGETVIVEIVDNLHIETPKAKTIDRRLSQHCPIKGCNYPIAIFPDSEVGHFFFESHEPKLRIQHTFKERRKSGE